MVILINVLCLILEVSLFYNCAPVLTSFEISSSISFNLIMLKVAKVFESHILTNPKISKERISYSLQFISIEFMLLLCSFRIYIEDSSKYRAYT